MKKSLIISTLAVLAFLCGAMDVATFNKNGKQRLAKRFPAREQRDIRSGGRRTEAHHHGTPAVRQVQVSHRRAGRLSARD